MKPDAGEDAATMDAAVFAAAGTTAELAVASPPPCGICHQSPGGLRARLLRRKAVEGASGAETVGTGGAGARGAVAGGVGTALASPSLLSESELLPGPLPALITP